MIDKLDAKDRQLISLLRSNARMPIVSLAKQLKVSRATVQNRIIKLEKEGIILGYSIKIKPEVETHPIKSLMNISVEAKNELKVIGSLQAYPEVVAIHHTSGHWDLIAVITTETLPLLNAILSEIRIIQGIVRTETNLLLDTIH
ncbi:Lrp/AsnC family transcriptional regulator [Aliivibrio kagoshimensis]|jgi:DNA-binding Lrp family transcriptional regulator|uniref:Lrp/AsnC family transcriptional regulator n=1 Tax=Aliivibrio kagoshimensis TaxID=2910230 RepID=UPI003D114A4D